MEYQFPPLPPEYTQQMLARWLCVAWILFNLFLLVLRVRRWKDGHVTDAIWWFGVAVVGWILVKRGESYRAWISNGWLIPLGMAVLLVAVVGTVACLCKLYRDARWGKLFLIVLIDGVSLTWMLLPSLGHPREVSNKLRCRNMLKQIGFAMHDYTFPEKRLPPPVIGEPPHSWRIPLLRYLDHVPMYHTYDRSKAWDSPTNDPWAKQRMEPYVCPSNQVPQDLSGRWYSAYSMPTGPHTVGDSLTGTEIRAITDGTSNTLLIVEACGSQIVWTEPRDINVVTQPTGINLKGAKPGQSAGWVSSYHLAGAQVLMSDGSVKFLNQKIDPTVLKNLATKDGGEEVKGF